MDWKKEVFTVSTSLKNRKWLLSASRKTAKCGLINYGKQKTVDLFRSLDIPVRTLECCSGDLADLKVKSVDVEAWSPRQKKYFEVGKAA